MIRPTERARAVLLGLFGSTAGVVQELTEAHDLLRAPLPLSRRVSMVGLAGGSGTSAVAASCASLLASRRRGPVLAVDAAGGPYGLAGQLGCSTLDAPMLGGPMLGGPMLGGVDALAAARRRRGARSGAAAREGLPRTESGLYVLDVVGSARHAAAGQAWSDQVTPIARFFDLVVTDWGVRPAAADLLDVATASHVVALVVRAEAAAGEATELVAALGRLQARPVRVVVVLVNVGRSRPASVRRLRKQFGVAVATVSYAPQRGAGAPPDSRDFGARTRRDHLRLTSVVMGEVLASRAPAVVSQPARTAAA